jgi:hypothetical protein
MKVLVALLASPVLGLSTLVFSPRSVQALTFSTLDFSAGANARLQDVPGDTGGIGLLESYLGNQTFGGVPFFLPNSPTNNNSWHSYLASDDNPQELNINVGIAGATVVHTLIGSYWGERTDGTFAALEFFGSNGAYFKKDLDGDADVRDYLNSSYTNSINGTTTQQVATWTVLRYNNLARLDKQAITLPIDFQNQTLTSIRLSDNGDVGFQRVFLAGATVESNPPAIPTPALLPGLLGLGISVWRKRKQTRTVSTEI